MSNGSKEWTEVRVNSRWDRSIQGTGMQRNAIITNTARVMAVVEGYVVARFKDAVPFVIHLSEWHQKFTPKPCASPITSKEVFEVEFMAEVNKCIALLKDMDAAHVRAHETTRKIDPKP